MFLTQELSCAGEMLIVADSRSSLPGITLRAIAGRDVCDALHRYGAGML